MRESSNSVRRRLNRMEQSSSRMATIGGVLGATVGTIAGALLGGPAGAVGGFLGGALVGSSLSNLVGAVTGIFLPIDKPDPGDE